MINVGITGQPGFIGTHLYNTLGLYPDEFKRIHFEDSFFQDDTSLRGFVKNCDTIVHLAAVNRHDSQEVLYQTNIELVNKIIRACDKSRSKPHIIFSSSIQEQLDNFYGKSKKEGRIIFEKWAKQNNASFTALLIPNVYGPFGRPYYNSVVATFCQQLTHNEEPFILNDNEINLIYVGELVDEIIKNIKTGTNRSDPKTRHIIVSHTSKIKVSELLNLLRNFKHNYFERGEIPSMQNSFHRNLFNTLLCYVDCSEFFPFKLNMKSDQRGSFVELIKLNSGGQISFSTTKPGIIRGNHFHTRKAERFAVIKGKAKINIRRVGTNNIHSFLLDGKQPAFVDMPVWHTHNIINTGNEELFTIFWINEHFNPKDTDTYNEFV